MDKRLPSRTRSADSSQPPDQLASAQSESLDQLAAARADDVLRAVIDTARDGDMRACEIVLSRAWPVRKSAARNFELRDINGVEDIPGAVSDVLAAVANGRLTIDEGTAVTGIIDVQRKTIELVEFHQRLNAVERKVSGG